MRDLKYLIAYIPIIAAYIGVFSGGWLSFAGLIVAFGIIPTVEIILKGNGKNLASKEEETYKYNRFFDWLLYLNIPLLYGLIAYYFYTILNTELATYEIVGMTISVGIINGTAGINVAHELGHRNTKFEQLFALLLLLPNLYMHFYIEHNLGHHKHVATEKDAASARYGEIIYAFFLRSVIGSYISAWKIENSLLEKRGVPIYSLQNRMIRYTIFQLLYLTGLNFLLGIAILKFALIIAMIGFLLLESVNYIEHYGLKRKKLSSGRYEPVTAMHSWNSNHSLGRIVLYELTRHADHHYKSTRKYQILRHFDDSPQLPFGYPASIIVALLPPVWFALMNKRVKKIQGI